MRYDCLLLVNFLFSDLSLLHWDSIVWCSNEFCHAGGDLGSFLHHLNCCSACPNLMASMSRCFECLDAYGTRILTYDSDSFSSHVDRVLWPKRRMMDNALEILHAFPLRYVRLCGGTSSSDEPLRSISITARCLNVPFVVLISSLDNSCPQGDIFRQIPHLVHMSKVTFQLWLCRISLCPVERAPYRFLTRMSG